MLEKRECEGHPTPQVYRHPNRVWISKSYLVDKVEPVVKSLRQRDRSSLEAFGSSPSTGVQIMIRSVYRSVSPATHLGIKSAETLLGRV